MEGGEDPLADDVSQLVLGHAAVQAERGDQVDVFHAGLRRHVDDLFHHELAHIRRRHRRQRQRQVVEGDRQLHAPPQQSFQRVVLQGPCKRALDRTLGVRDRLQRIGWVHDARAEGQLLEPDALAKVKQHRRCVAIDLDHRTWSWHQAVNRRRSNATFTAPKRPALMA